MRRITILLAALAALMLVPAAQAFANGTVTVHIEGSGMGELSSVGGLLPGEPPIECTYASPGPEGGNCESELPPTFGLEGIELHAVLASGFRVAEWEVVGTSHFAFCGKEELKCTAYGLEGEEPEIEIYAVIDHELPSFPLTVTKAGNGSGSIKCFVNGSSFEEACQAEYKESTKIVLSPFKDPGSTFTGWTGCDSVIVEPERESCEVTMTGPKSVTATFNKEGSGPVGPPLTTIIEAGEGTVVSNPAGIECTGSSGHECTTEEIAEGETVTLTASPASGYLFKSWKNCDKTTVIPGVTGVNGRQCTIKLTEGHKAVGASFVKADNLAVSKAGPGIGAVSTSPGGVNCGATCLSSTAAYKEGSLTIKEKPNKHFHFVEFKNGSGSAAICDGQSEACAISSFDSNSSVEAEFAEDAKNTLSYSATGGGQGFVKTKPTGINCGYTCSAAAAEFFANEGEVEVSVKLNKGTSSVTWTTAAGTCTGKVEAIESTCKVPMSADHSLVAKFE